MRSKAAEFLGASWPGEEAVVKLLKADRLDGEIKEAALEGVKNAFREEIKLELAPFFPKKVEPVISKEEEPRKTGRRRRR